jgi:hypothetical protein
MNNGVQVTDTWWMGQENTTGQDLIIRDLNATEQGYDAYYRFETMVQANL